MLEIRLQLRFGNNPDLNVLAQLYNSTHNVNFCFRSSFPGYVRWKSLVFDNGFDLVIRHFYFKEK